MSRSVKVAFAAIVVFVVAVVVAVSVVVLRQPEPAAESLPSPPADPRSTDLPTPEDWPVARESPSPGEPGDGSFETSDVDRSNPDAVAERFAVMVSSWDTATDETKSEAMDRARPLMGGDLAGSLSTPVRPTAWGEPAQHQAFTVPAATPVDHHQEHGEEAPTLPSTGEKVKPYTFRVSYQWQGRDGWTSKEPSYQVVYLSLAKRDSRWQVVEYGAEEVTPPPSR